MPPRQSFKDVEKLTELKREIRMRHSVYPRWIARGMLTQDEADRQIAILEAVAADYENVPATLPGLD